MEPNSALLLDKRTTADRLGISLRSVEQLIRNGELASVKIGRLRRIPAHALENFCKRSHKTKAVGA